MGKMDNKIIIMSGTSTGTGRASAKLFTQEGGIVVGLDWNEKDNLTLAEEIKAAGGVFTPMHCDIGVSAQVKACVDKVIEMYGRIDVLVNFAGTTDLLRFVTEANDEIYAETMKNNLTGPFYMCREVLPHMIAKKNGCIVNCASIGGVKGYGGGAAYSMAKHGLVGLGRVIAAEYLYDGIRCNTVCPGGINTQMGTVILDKSRPENLDENGKLIAGPWLKKCVPYNNSYALMKAGVQFNSEPEDQAKVFLFLASDDSRFITGEEIIVAGGCVQR